MHDSSPTISFLVIPPASSNFCTESLFHLSCTNLEAWESLSGRGRLTEYRFLVSGADDLEPNAAIYEIMQQGAGLVSFFLLPRVAVSSLVT